MNELVARNASARSAIAAAVTMATMEGPRQASARQPDAAAAQDPAAQRIVITGLRARL